MRIRFFQPTSEAESAAFVDLERRAREFWRHFRTHQRRPVGEWVSLLSRELNGVSPYLTLEIDAEQRRLFVLPTSGQRYLPLATLVVEASGNLGDWSAATQRPGLPLERALTRVASATKLDLKAARLKIGVDRGHALSIVVGHYLFQGNDDELGGDAAELLVARVLGDATFERWISSVDVVSAPRPSPLKLVGQQDANLPLPLEELEETITTAVNRITDTLPEAPLHEYCDRADWMLFEMGELRSPDEEYPLPDLQVATTMCPEMLKSFLSGIPFASERFSRCGERFAYLQIDTRGQDRSQSLEQRMALEEALDYALVPGRLGCVVGAGVGETYMYVFLSLHDMAPALRQLQRQLQEHRVSKRTWLRFCDPEWSLEWIGAYADSPEPAV